MNGESKKYGYFAKALSNHVHTVLMGTVQGRCTAIKKSKYCFVNLGSFFLLPLDRPLQGV